MRVRKEFSSPEARDLARRWQGLPVGTLVRNGDQSMVYLGWVEETAEHVYGLPNFWFWSFNSLSEWKGAQQSKYEQHLTSFGVGAIAWFKVIDVEGW